MNFSRHPDCVIAPSHHRDPEIAILRRSHLSGHNPDDSAVLIMQGDRAAEYRRVGIENASPQAITDYDNRRRTGLVLLLSKRSANFRPQTDYAEKISCNCCTGNACGIAARNAA